MVEYFCKYGARDYTHASSVSFRIWFSSAGLGFDVPNLLDHRLTSPCRSSDCMVVRGLC